MWDTFFYFFVFLGDPTQNLNIKKEEGLNKREGESEMLLKFMKKKEFLLNRMARWLERIKIPAKYIFSTLNMLVIMIVQNKQKNVSKLTKIV